MTSHEPMKPEAPVTHTVSLCEPILLKNDPGKKMKATRKIGRPKLFCCFLADSRIIYALDFISNTLFWPRLDGLVVWASTVVARGW